MTRVLLFCLVVLTCCLTPDVAYADAVGPPPTNCPAGARGESSHGGQFCSPMPECNAVDTCNTGRCREVSLCIETQTFSGGMCPDTADCSWEAQVVTGTCREGGTCDEGDCVTERRCATGVGGSCGCSSVGGVSAVAGVFALFLGVLVRGRGDAP